MAPKQGEPAGGASPEQTVRRWFEAVFAYLDPATREMGRGQLAELTLPFADDPEWDTRPGARVFVTRLTDSRFHHIFRSYLVGATPENDYRVDPGRFELTLADSGEDPFGRGWQVLLSSSGAEAPRSMVLARRGDGRGWVVSAFAAIYAGVRPPAGSGFPDLG